MTIKYTKLALTFTKLQTLCRKYLFSSKNKHALKYTSYTNFAQGIFKFKFKCQQTVLNWISLYDDT